MMTRPFVINAHNKQYAIQQIERLDVSATQYEMTIRPRKSKRSLEQNDWARKFARDMANYIGEDPDRMYEILMYKCNPVFSKDPLTGHEIRMPGSFSKLNTSDAAQVQESMLRFGESIGFLWEAAA